MTQEDRLLWLIHYLIWDEKEYHDLEIPMEEDARKRMLRSLMNVRPPKPISDEFLVVQDEYLQGELAKKTVVNPDDLTPRKGNLCLWRGDITLLAADGIVNAANSALLGCFVPCHGCIDNAIHSAAGVELRLACKKLMDVQGHGEPVGTAKITPAFNLPSRHVLHTVGPYVAGALTDADREALRDCYRACLNLAKKEGLTSLAFCCISTGEFHFPPREAAKIAVETVKNWQKDNGSEKKVIFNVFKESDYEYYRDALG